MLKFKIKFNIFAISLIKYNFFIYFILIIHKKNFNNIIKLANNLNKLKKISKKLKLKNLLKITSLYLYFKLININKLELISNKKLIGYNKKIILTFLIFKNYISNKTTKFLIKLETIKIIEIILFVLKTFIKIRKKQINKIKKLISNYEKEIFCSLTKIDYKNYYIYKTKIDKSYIHKDIEFNYRYVKNSRALLSNYNFISIDEENTIEIDDAICINKANNKIEILIGIIDLSEYIPISLFHKAYNNQASLYFTYNNFYMLIDKNIIKNFSLLKNSIKPAIIFRLLFSKDLELISFDFDFKLIKIKENISYNFADKYKILNEYDLDKIADKLLDNRLKKGGIFLNIPKIKLDKNLKKLELIYFKEGYRFIIQELMILTNYITSKIAIKNNIPFIYLHNNTTLSNNLQGKIIDNPLEIYNTIKNLDISFYSLQKKNHNLIGLESYSHITSPIRRFIDIVNQRQLLSLFYNIDPYYNNSELQEFTKIANNENLNRNNLYKNYYKTYLKYFLYINNINTLKGYITNIKDNVLKIFLTDYFIEIEENKEKVQIINGKLESNKEIIFKVLP